MKYFRYLGNIIRFMQLPKERRRLTFYSEGKNYWAHLGDLVEGVLKNSNIPVCYISSDANDPGLHLQSPNYCSFLIDERWIRNWLFQNIDTEVMVMTMPDLDQFQVKRSRHPVHYVYVQHSLVSLHMAYRKGAFDHYDTLFCAGPHHVKETREMELEYNLPPKTIVEHGYGRLDNIIETAKLQTSQKKHPDTTKHVLVAPSWGPDSIIETIGDQVVDILLKQGFQVTLRPHPETFKSAKDKIDAIIKKHAANQLFSIVDNVAEQESLHQSDIMITDWSGSAFDYAFGLYKPVLFIDVPMKINNKNYLDISRTPFEMSIREVLGGVVQIDELSALGDLVNSINVSADQLRQISQDHVFNLGCSTAAGVRAILNLLPK